MSDKDKLEVLLTEWDLCQQNLSRHNDWLWQTGGIFIVLSLAALWALSQVRAPANRKWFFVFSSFSISTLVIWYIFIVRRVTLWFETTTQQLLKIESEIRELVGIQRDLLHTVQRGKLGHFRLKARYAVHSFIILVIAMWILAAYILFS